MVFFRSFRIVSIVLLLCTAGLYGDDAMPKINNIFVEGAKHIKKEAVLRRLPYKKGEAFDYTKSGEAVNHLYGLGYFRQIQIEREDIDEHNVNLYVVLEERKLLEKIMFEGNRKVKSKKIMSELGLDKLETIDEEQLKQIADGIKKLYRKENYHLAKVDHKIVPNKEVPDKASILFTVQEGVRARVKKIVFRGNTHMPDRKLRSILLTKEDWILGFLGDDGTYNEEMLEMDKKRMEYFYRDNGYLMAKIANVDVAFSENNKEITITFDVREGEQFYVRYISAPGDELFGESDLLPYVELEQGKPFSQSKLVKSIEKLKARWGDLGYIYADVYPQVVPNEDTMEVDVTFHADREKKMFVNRINIVGNKVTKDRVIRRELEIEEGDLITSKKLRESQSNVEYLGFFEKGTVNWKIHKIKEGEADLELGLREAKTGKLNAGLSYGSDKGSAKRTLRGNLSLSKSNFLGRGFDIGAGVQSSLRRFQSGSVYFFDPHIFDTDISSGLSMYIKQQEYDQWKYVTPSPVEKIVGMSSNVGFLLPWLSRRTRVGVEWGVERIRNNSPKVQSAIHEDLLQPIVDRSFQTGTHVWFGFDIGKDTRNHRVYPNRGYKILFSTRTAPPGLNKEFSFIKSEFDVSWYTPLIGEDTLVLMVHGSGGIVDHIKKDKIVPYKELFHMGGQNTVRGFVWGGIGPAWQTGAPLGARKAFQFNAELIFPIVPDYSMKGHFFYDAGAGWDTPKQGIKDKSKIRRDRFNLRHSVGFGINLVNPFPAKIDWGYKLDRDKKAGESPYEFHISMNTAW